MKLEQMQEKGEYINENPVSPREFTNVFLNGNFEYYTIKQAVNLRSWRQ